MHWNSWKKFPVKGIADVKFEVTLQAKSFTNFLKLMHDLNFLLKQLSVFLVDLCCKNPRVVYKTYSYASSSHDLDIMPVKGYIC